MVAHTLEPEFVLLCVCVRLGGGVHSHGAEPLPVEIPGQPQVVRVSGARGHTQPPGSIREFRAFGLWHSILMIKNRLYNLNCRDGRCVPRTKFCAQFCGLLGKLESWHADTQEMRLNEPTETWSLHLQALGLVGGCLWHVSC